MGNAATSRTQLKSKKNQKKIDFDYINPNTIYITDPTQLNTKVSKSIKKRLMDIIHDGKLDFESIVVKNKYKKIVSQYIHNLSHVLNALDSNECECLKIIRTKLIELKMIDLIENEELYQAFDDMLYDLLNDLKEQAHIDYINILESIK